MLTYRRCMVLLTRPLFCSRDDAAWYCSRDTDGFEADGQNEESYKRTLLIRIHERVCSKKSLVALHAIGLDDILYRDLPRGLRIANTRDAANQGEWWHSLYMKE